MPDLFLTSRLVAVGWRKIRRNAMNIETLRGFFLWCTLLNGGLLIFSSLLLMFAGDFVYSLHHRWFPMPRETLNVALYIFLGFWKIIVITFNLVPWLVLRLIG
jgi:hypothetical protein